MLHCVVLCCVVLCCFELCYIVLCCAVLFCIGVHFTLIYTQSFFSGERTLAAKSRDPVNQGMVNQGFTVRQLCYHRYDNVVSKHKPVQTLAA